MSYFEPVYACMYVDVAPSSADTVCTTLNTDYTLAVNTFGSGGPTLNCTLSATDGITVGYTGIYEINMHISYEPSSGTTFSLKITKGGVTQDNLRATGFTTSTVYGRPLSIRGLLSLAAGDVIYGKVSASSSSETFAVMFGTFSVVRIA